MCSSFYIVPFSQPRLKIVASQTGTTEIVLPGTLAILYLDHPFGAGQRGAVFIFANCHF